VNSRDPGCLDVGGELAGGVLKPDETAGLLAEALSAAEDPAATLVRLVSDLEPGEVARLRTALDAAADREPR